MQLSSLLTLSLNNICIDGVKLLRHQAARIENNHITLLGDKFLIDALGAHDYPDLPASFIWLINLAKQHNCRFVNVDPEGPVVAGIPIYEHAPRERGMQYIEVDLGDCDGDYERSVTAKLRISALGISVGVDPDAVDEPIHIELNRGLVTAHIWADPEQEDPTHQVSILEI